MLRIGKLLLSAIYRSGNRSSATKTFTRYLLLVRCDLQGNRMQMEGRYFGELYLHSLLRAMPGSNYGRIMKFAIGSFTGLWLMHSGVRHRKEKIRYGT